MSFPWGKNVLHKGYNHVWDRRWKSLERQKHEGMHRRHREGILYSRGQRRSKLAFSEGLPDCLVETSPQFLTMEMFPFLTDLENIPPSYSRGEGKK